MDDPRKWVQIADDLRGKIISGELEPGSQVPIAHQAQLWGCSRITTAKAFGFLCRTGLLLEPSPGGTYRVPLTLKLPRGSS